MTTETQSGKLIKNVSILDLRTATPATLAGISRINNAGLVLYSTETAELVNQLAIDNTSGRVLAPANAQVSTGQIVLSHGSLANQSESLHIVLDGQLIVQPDVEPEEIAKGVGSLIVIGQIVCPKHLVGAIQVKIRYLDGQVATSSDEKGQVGNLDLTQEYLQGLPDNSELKIVGTLSATAVLSNDLLKQKIKRIEIVGKVICCEENAATVRALLAGGGGALQMIVIPTGYLYLGKPLVLDADQIQALPSKKLYCAWLRITDDVDVNLLNSTLEQLIVTDTLICPSSLRATLAQKCDLLKPRTIFYQGELWYVENDLTLLAPRFDYLADKATLLVVGTLNIAADVDPKVLARRLAKVHNMGSIHGAASQIAAIQSRLGIDEGEFIDTTASVAEADNVINNVSYLKL
jgi:hypothetical protein